MSDMRALAMKRILMVVMLCLGSFGSGYWLNEWLNRRVVNAALTRSLSWAIDTGLLTVNHERLKEMKAAITPSPADIGTTRSPDRDPEARPASGILLP
jgi:hypothetical protein